MMLPTEGTQQRSAMVRGTTCLQGIAVPSYSKASMKRTNPSRKTSPYTAQAMKVHSAKLQWNPLMEMLPTS